MRITARGWAVLAAAFGLAGTGWRLGVGELVMLGIISLTLAFASLLTIAASARPHQITVVRRAPAQLFCGQKTAVTLQIIPRKRLDGGVLTDLTPAALNASGAQTLARGNALELKYAITPTQTGHWALGPLRWQQSDVFGLWVVTWMLGEATRIVAWPRLTSLPVAGKFAARQVPVGAASGASPDDVTLREYVPGDDLRRIHWPTTARKGFPMVRENAGTTKKSLRVLIDPALLANQKTREWALEHGASVACSALDSEHRVEIVGGSQVDFIDCQITGRQQILTQIAQLAASPVSPGKTPAVANSRPVPGVITYAIVSSNFAFKGGSTTSGSNHAVVVGSSRDTGQTAENLRNSGWRVLHLAKPIPHQAAWAQQTTREPVGV